MRGLIRSPFSGRQPARSLNGSPGAVAALPSTIDLRAGYLSDDLTGLGSLLALREQLERIIDLSPPFGPRPAVLLIDIDGFSRLNLTYGRDAADQVLVAMASRLRTLAPEPGAAYRVGGDEFVALLEPTETFAAVAAAGQIQAALSQPVEAGGSVLQLTVSIAVVMLGHRHRVDGLLRDADVTMYRAKTEGGNRVDVYNWETDSWSTARKKDADRLAKEVDELRRQNRVLADAVTHDLDTGMPNGLALDADHMQVHARFKRASEPYAVILARVDGLDTAADFFHSQDGIKAVTAVAYAIRDTVRLTDRAYRLGHGDFAVLLPGSGLKQAVGAAERIRARVEGLGLEHQREPGRAVTVTMALTEVGFRHSEPKDVVAEVSGLLSSAASQGHNRIVWPS